MSVGVATASATARDVMQWKPSACSRSLPGISALSAPPARILARADDSAPDGRRDPASPFQSARSILAGSATGRSTLRRPVHPEFSWRTERARAAGARAVACAGPILASAGRCGCSSENIPRSDRQRPEGFQGMVTTAVLSPPPLSSSPNPSETTDSYADRRHSQFIDG